MKQFSIWFLLLLILGHLTPQFGKIGMGVTFGCVVLSLVLMVMGLIFDKN